MSLASNDQPSTLPTEIWLHIIPRVPRATLYSLIKVNRALRQMSLPMLLEILDLDPLQRRASHAFPLQRMKVTKDQYSERKSFLQRLLRLAETAPDIVRVIHLVPYHGFIEDVYPKRGFLKHDVRSVLRPLTPAFMADRISSKTHQEHIEEMFLSILHSLVNVQELHIQNVIQYHFPSTKFKRCRSIDTAWASWATQLTLLSLSVSNDWDIGHLCSYNSTSYSLPLLRTYKVHFCAREPVSNPDVTTIQAIFDLVRHSPLLEDFEYSLYDPSWAWYYFDLKLPQITVHPNLRSFTWSRVRPCINPPRNGYFFPTSAETCLSQYASQLLSVHLDPVPTIGLSFFFQVDTPQLTELRLNIRFAASPLETFKNLSELRNLRILELSGWPWMGGHSNLRRMEALEELYFPIYNHFFNVLALHDTAEKTPRLRKLVLRFEGEAPPENPCDRPHGLSEFQTASTTSMSFHTWSLKDFGAHVPGAESCVLNPLVTAIARLVPSIVSLYGTGTMTVPRMVSVDPDWFGKLK